MVDYNFDLFLVRVDPVVSLAPFLRGRKPAEIQQRNLNAAVGKGHGRGVVATGMCKYTPRNTPNQQSRQSSGFSGVLQVDVRLLVLLSF